jgi:hypothetical protein
MRIKSTETLQARGTPALRTMTLFECALANFDEPRGNGAAVQTRFWVRTSNYVWASGAAVAGLSLRSYYMRETLVSLALFSLLFLSVSLVVLSLFCICYAGHCAAVWVGPASRALIAPFMQQDLGGAEFAPVRVVEDSAFPANGGKLERQSNRG